MASYTFPWEKGTRIALVGMGRTNTSLFELLKNRPDLSITLRDKNEEAVWRFSKEAFAIKTYTAERYLTDLYEDVIFLSPTIRTDHPKICSAMRRGAKITSDISFFLENKKSTCFALTGSDGKSTTASLAHSILCENGFSSRLGGNIGKAVTPFLFSEKAGSIIKPNYTFCPRQNTLFSTATTPKSQAGVPPFLPTYATQWEKKECHVHRTHTPYGTTWYISTPVPIFPSMSFNRKEQRL